VSKGPAAAAVHLETRRSLFTRFAAFCLAMLRRFRLNLNVSESPIPRRPRPPHNPGVRKLVEGKRRGSSPASVENLKQGFRGWNERGYLPHRDEPGLVQFVTFRLFDSFPEALHSEWEHLWKVEDDRQRRLELEGYLDRGRGGCLLRRPEIAGLVDEAIRFFYGQRYDLRGWVIMPNHVHVLFKVDTTPMAEILESWKKHTAQKANRLLGRRDGFWQIDYWDTYIRDARHEMQARKYIESNPTKVRLVLHQKDWPWSSARFRDQSGALYL
jgi:putative transposase